jgi:hypothetical protein
MNEKEALLKEEKEALLKEFESLRQEIMDHQSRREKIFLFTIAAFGVVLGFIINLTAVPFIIVSFVPYIIIFNFCKIAYIQSTHIITIGTYIHHFIAEHYEYALQWEKIWDWLTKQKEIEKTKDGKKKREEYLKGGGYWFYFCLIALIVYCIGIIALGLFEDGIFRKLKFQPILPFSILHLLACISCFYFGVKNIHWARLNKKARNNSEKNWNAYKNSPPSSPKC